METRYDIFSGTRDNSPLWLEAVTDLNQAVFLMNQRAMQIPGDYFVFHTRSQTVVASIHANPDDPDSSGGVFAGR